MLDKKKKKEEALFTKKFAFKNHFLGMKLKVSFSKRDFDEKKKKT